MLRFTALLCCALFFLHCQRDAKRQAADLPSDRDGSTLAHQYCGSCHVFPEPSLLPRQIWLNKIMPNMATRMGLPMGFPYQKLDVEDMQAVMNAHVIPDNPLLSMEDMQRIVEYYAQNAPAQSLPQERSVQPEATLDLFTIRKSGLPLIGTQNIMLKALPDQQQVVLSFEDKGSFVYQPNHKTYQSFSNVAASACGVSKDHLYLLELGTTQAYNLPKGKLWSFQLPNLDQPKIVIDSLIRPVSMDIADLNADGQPDFILCEFGDYLGRLTLHLSTPQGYQRTVLKNYPGACQASFRDMNRDGRLDIAVLMSQGREELCLFLNQGENLPFKEVSIATFPPSYGCNAMEIADMNNDGYPDILLTNGDNADISYSRKAYHGIRLYQNDGAGQFSMQWFYPIYGASDVVAADFDQDGATDMAVIAHFPDFNSAAPEDFIFFKKESNALNFKPLRFKTPLNGRLLTLEKTDIDHDGDQDILIGNYIDQLTDAGKWYADWTAKPCDWWILENKARR